MQNTTGEHPIRILHFFGIMNRGGAESFLMDIYRHLDRNAVQFDFAVHDGQVGHFDAEITELGGRIFVLPSPGKVGVNRYKKEVSRLLAEQGPFHGVHSQVYYFSGLILKVARECGVKVRIANSNSIQDGKSSTLYRRMYRWYMTRLIVKHSTHLLGVSREACKSLFGANCFETMNKVDVIPNAIDLTKFNSLPDDKAILRRKLGLPVPNLLIGHVGRFNPPKNHAFLIEAFAHVHRLEPEARLVLVGDGPLRQEIEALIAANGLQDFVYLLGIRQDVPEILGAMDVFVFPSLYEGLGLSLVEAQAAGVPSVISDTIPADVDLELGLITMLSLKQSPRAWAEEILEQNRKERRNWETVERHIVERNYEIGGSSRKLQALYMG